MVDYRVHCRRASFKLLAVRTSDTCWRVLRDKLDRVSRHRVFLLSPAHSGGVRAGLLFRPEASFDLAVRLRREGAPIGEVFAFVSGLYFRGKLAYAQAFAAPPPGLPGALVVTSGRGLVAPETVVGIDELRELAAVAIEAGDPRYRLPLERDCRALDERAGSECDYVLLGSVATRKYLDPMCGVFGERLLYPEEFAGRGDMSRGALMLRCAREGVELTYAPAGGVTRSKPRPPR